MPPFVSKRRVGFGEVDWARILYYPRFFHHCHLAFEEFAEAALGMPYADFLEREGLGFPTVHIEADYVRPIPYGAELEIAVSVVRVGEKSMIVRYEGRVPKDETPRVTAEVTNVLVSMDDFTPRAIPEWVRTGLAPWSA